MTKTMNVWQTEELTKTFLEGVRGAIPGADMQLAVIGKIAQHWCDAPSSILDIGCGDAILGSFLLNIFPTANGVFIDFSEPMLDAARKNLSDIPQTSVVVADFSRQGWLDAVVPYRPFDIIISGFAIHHQPDERKQKLYSEIYDLLLPGGVFLNLEHVASFTPAVEQLFDEYFIDHLHVFNAKSNSRKSREEIADTYRKRPDKKENILAPVDEQCRWLRDIGFRDVDCFFKVFELALFGGRKATSKSDKVNN